LSERNIKTIIFLLYCQTMNSEKLEVSSKYWLLIKKSHITQTMV